MKSSFEGLDSDELNTHCRIKNYNGFILPDGLVPSYSVDNPPIEGYRFFDYMAPDGSSSPLLRASISSHRLYEVFRHLAAQVLPDEIDVFFQSSYGGELEELVATGLDTVSFLSTLDDYRYPLVHDGCSGICLLGSGIEIQFEEHKTLIVYTDDFTEVELIINEFKLERINDMVFFFDSEHIHLSSFKSFVEFAQLIGKYETHSI